jgi:2-dehydropantoate 2-reductase
MRICIFGAGAVGSHFAVRLALAGHEVSCVMRGPHLEAVKARGLTLRVGDAEFSARVKASDDPATLGPQDFVISTLKATGLSSLATGLPPLLRDDMESCSPRTAFHGGTISARLRIIRRRRT